MKNKRRPTHRPLHEVVARGIFITGGRILLNQLVRESFYFLPGGSIERGESAHAALAREMKEELGVRATNLRIVGVVENRFDAGHRYEINLIFSGTLSAARVTAQEAHLTFSWHPLATLLNIRLFPLGLAVAILKWRKEKRPFILTENHGPRP